MIFARKVATSGCVPRPVNTEISAPCDVGRFGFSKFPDVVRPLEKPSVTFRPANRSKSPGPPTFIVSPIAAMLSTMSRPAVNSVWSDALRFCP